MEMTVGLALLLNCAVAFLLYWLARYTTRCETRVAIYHAEDYYLSNSHLSPEEARLIMRYTVYMLNEINGNYNDEED